MKYEEPSMDVTRFKPVHTLFIESEGGNDTTVESRTNTTETDF